MQLLICRKCVLFWLDLSIFSYWTPWMLKANIWVMSFACYLLESRFPKTEITREQQKFFFWLTKNEDKQIVGDHLKLYFYYINKEQKLVVMYLEVIFTWINTERWKIAKGRKGRKDFLCRGWDQQERWFVPDLKQGECQT